ncbi:MAG: MFS transporter [Alphaproteobacteria bacterium]|nr:MFS transporter [Alphaproteobacteria bacterium]
MSATEPSAPAPDDNRRRSFLLLFSTLLVVGFGNTMLLALLPPLARRMGLADTSVGWIFSLSALIWVFASSFWGRMSDRKGRKPIIALGLGAYCVSMTLFALICIVGVNHWVSPVVIFFGLLLSRAIFGAVGSASSPAGQAYVADRTTQEERTEELASLGSAFALGATLGPALSGILAAQVGPIAPLFLVAFLAATASFAVMRFLPESKTPELPLESNKKDTSWKLALDPRVSGHLLYGLGISVVTGMLQQTFTFYTMDRLKLDEATTIVYASNGLMVGALALLATQLGLLRLLKLQGRSLMVLGAIVIACGVLLQISATTLNFLLVAQFMQGVGFGLARPGFSGGASLSVKPEEQGGLAGLTVAVSGAGFVISPLAGVTLYEFAGMHAPLWLAVGILVSMALFALISRRLRSTGGVSSSPSGGAEGG